MSLTLAPASLPTVVGVSLEVPVVSGKSVQYANLDHAASAPCLDRVRCAVDELLPWYASVHRGAGFASQACTQVYEQARDIVRHFVGAHPSDVVVFTRNTTDALNLLARAVPRGTAVLRFDSDHHAALLPWRGRNVRRIPVPESPSDALRLLDEALRGCPVGPRLVCVTGASNITGELWPVAELVGVARKHGARVVLDAAQLAPHRPIRALELGVDYVVLSGHKLYAPFGTGALIGRADWLRAAEPYLAGGGASKRVSEQGDQLSAGWATGPERHEAGSPNVVGAYALAVACQTIVEHGWADVVRHEDELLDRLRAGLAEIPGVTELSIFGPGQARVGTLSLTVRDADPGQLAAALSAEYGIGVRDGAFCAHVGTRTLLGRAAAQRTDRALRISLGLGTTVEHVDRLLAALAGLVQNGPRWDYAVIDGRWTPTPDPRSLPTFLTTIPALPVQGGGCPQPALAG